MKGSVKKERLRFSFLAGWLTLCLTLSAFGQGDETRARANVLFEEGRNLIALEKAVELRIGLEKVLQARALFRELKDREDQAMCLSWIGNANRFLGNYKAAAEAWSESLSMSDAVRDPSVRSDVVLTLNSNLGGAYQALGEYGKAISHFDQARKIADAVGDKTTVAQLLSSAAIVHAELGDSNLALTMLIEAISYVDVEKDPGNTALIYNNIASIYLNRIVARPILIPLENPKAIEYLAKAVELLKSGCENGECNRLLLVNVLNNLGKALEFERDLDQALDTYKKSLGFVEALGDSNLKAKLLTNIGSVYVQKKDLAKAIEYLYQALPLFEAAGDRNSKALTLAGAMQIWRDLANPRLGILYGKQAVSEYQKLRNTVRSFDPSVQRSYLRQIEPNYRILASLLISEGRISEAEQVLGMLKEEEILDYLKRDDKVAKELLQTVSLTESERNAVIRYEKLASDITALGKEFGDLDRERLSYDEDKFPKQARYDRLKKQLEDATVAFQRYLDELKVSFGQKDERVVQVDSSLRNTLKSMNATRTAVVSTIVGESKLNLIFTTADTQRAHTVDIKAADLNALVVEFRRALTDPRVDPRPAGQKLYDVLVKPIESDLAGINADTIIWSLDGTLRYLPTAALFDRQKGYLAERFATGVVTLASRDTLSLSPGNKPAMRALGVGVSKGTEGFTALTAVPDELDCIVTDAQTKTVSTIPVCNTGVHAGRKLLDDRFTRSAFESALGRYAIVHVASHFNLEPGNDNDSFLLLGGGAEKRFTVENLRGVRLANVELIVLSACNTATPGGEKANGVEIEGFGAVAQKQGAKSVLASLWPVADESTRDLMVEFYKTYSRSEVSKAAALQSAQKQMISGRMKPSGKQSGCRAKTYGGAGAKPNEFKCDPKAPFTHPYFWAPFVLMGNWQ